MNEDIGAETIWRGRLTEDGPPMRIVENDRGQFLQRDVVEPCNVPPDIDEPRTKGMLF